MPDVELARPIFAQPPQGLLALIECNDLPAGLLETLGERRADAATTHDQSLHGPRLTL